VAEPLKTPFKRLTCPDLLSLVIYRKIMRCSHNFLARKYKPKIALKGIKTKLKRAQNKTVALKLRTNKNSD